MEMIMKIQDVFEISGKGMVLGGTNPEYENLTLPEIQQKIGNQIEVHHPNGSVSKFPVTNVEISESLLGQ